MAAKGTPITQIPTPPPLPKGVVLNVPPMPDWGFDGAPDINGVPRTCPPNSTPMVRVTVAEIVAAGGLDAYLARTRLSLPDDSEHTDMYAHDRVKFTPGGGGTGTQIYYGQSVMSVNGPAMLSSPGYRTNFAWVPSGDHSLSQLWMTSGTGYNPPNSQNQLPCSEGSCNDPGQTNCQSAHCLQTIEVGWSMVAGNTAPYFFNFATNNGYADGCWGVGGGCGDSLWNGSNPPTATPNPFIQYNQTWPTYMVYLGFTPPGGGTPTEYQASIYNPGDGNWYVIVAGNWIGYYSASFFHGAMQHTAEDFEAGGEVHDASDLWIQPMGTGASASAGYGQAAYLHDFYACYINNGFDCERYMTPKDTINGGLGQRDVYDHSTNNPFPNSWGNAFFFGNAPSVFWNQNYGYSYPPYTLNPLGSDWASGYAKGECGYTSISGTTLGSPLTGLSADPWSAQHEAHAIHCNSPLLLTTGSSCYTIPFNNPNSIQRCVTNGNWDPNDVMLTCDCGAYVMGISQSGNTGSVYNILCCPGQYVNALRHEVSLNQSSCTVQVFSGHDSSAYGIGPDWDPDNWKGQCPAGQYVAGISVDASQSGGGPGAPRVLLCCSIVP